MKVKWLDRTMLYSPHLALCTSEDEYKAACRRLKVHDVGEWLPENSNACVHNFTHSEEPPTCVVCCRLARDAVNQALTFSHEALHVFRRWLEYIGEESPGEEIEAHCVLNIAATLTEEYIRRLPCECDE